MTNSLVERLRAYMCSRGGHPVICDEAADRIADLEAKLAKVEGHLREQITHAETRIQDGIEMGATVWRIALEDIARENRQALAGDAAGGGA